jgi:ATP-dependent DNA helicase RecQ
VPAYRIFSNRTLAALALRRPRSPDELLEVDGIGERRLAAYGDAILAAVRGR